MDTVSRTPIADTVVTPARPPRVELSWQVWLPWLALGTMLVTATRADPDLWGHLRFGLDWWQTRSLPSVDPYSFTQDRPWVNHEWLSEVVAALAFKIGGAAGLVLMKSAVVAAALALIAVRMRGASPLVIVGVLTAASVGALPVTGTVRPQIWSLLALVLLVPLLSQTAPTAKRALAAAALFGLWANLHGGWITGGAALGLHALIRSVRRPREAPRWALLGTCALAATLVNPYGIGLWHFLGSTVRTSRPDIVEWLPFNPASPALLWMPLLLPTAALLLVLTRRDWRPSLETCAVVLLLLAAGLRVSRVGPLACPAIFALLAPSLRRAAGTAGVLSAPSRGAAAVLLMPAVFAVAAARVPVQRVLGCIPIDDTWAPDRTAAAYLVGGRGRLWSTFDWGQYAIWHFGPALQVSIDGRRETVYSDSLLEWHRAVERGEPEALARLVAVAPDYVWTRAGHEATRRWLEEHGYATVVTTDESFIAARADADPLPSTADPLSRCFP